MGIMEKLNNAEARKDEDIARIKELLEKNYNLQKKFTSEINKFLEEYKNVSVEKSIADDLVTMDGMLYLKDLVEINYSFCFDDFDKESLTALPLFFVSLENYKDAQGLKKAIPNISNFINSLENFLESHKINYGEYIAFGEERFISSNLEVSRFISVDKFEKIINEAEVLLDKNLPLFIEDLEDFVLSRGFSLSLPEKNKNLEFNQDEALLENIIKQYDESQKSKELKRITIVNDDADIGIKINDIFNEWNSIKNEAQSKAWKEKTLSFKTGTYKQFDLLDMVNKLKDESKEETYLEKEFKKELKTLLKPDDNKQKNVKKQR